MPINGICHDFAFSRCYDRNRWTTTLSAHPDATLWERIKSGYMGRFCPSDLGEIGTGVLTVVSPAQAMPSHCVHSYYVDEPSGFLLSTNDPFTMAVGAVQCVSVSIMRMPHLKN